MQSREVKKESSLSEFYNKFIELYPNDLGGLKARASYYLKNFSFERKGKEVGEIQLKDMTLIRALRSKKDTVETTKEEIDYLAGVCRSWSCGLEIAILTGRHCYKAKLAVEKKDWPAAWLWYSHAIKMYPASHIVLQRLRVAICIDDAELYPVLESNADTLVSSMPFQPSFNLTRAYYKLKVGKLQQFKSDFAVALLCDILTPKLLNKSEYALIIDLLQKEICKTENNSDGNDKELIKEGRRLVKKNQLENAVQSFKEAININFKNSIAFLELGRTFEKSKQFDDVLLFTVIAYWLNTRFPIPEGKHIVWMGVFIDIRNLLLEIGLIELAITLHEKALSLIDLSAQITPHNKWKALDLEKKLIPLLIRKGEEHLLMDDVEHAKKFFEFAISLVPDHREAHLNLGICYSQLNYLDEAKKIFAKLLIIDPSNKNVNFYLKRVQNQEVAIEQFGGRKYIVEGKRAKPIAVLVPSKTKSEEKKAAPSKVETSEEFIKGMLGQLISKVVKTSEKQKLEAIKAQAKLEAKEKYDKELAIQQEAKRLAQEKTEQEAKECEEKAALFAASKVKEKQEADQGKRQKRKQRAKNRKKIKLAKEIEHASETKDSETLTQNETEVGTETKPVVSKDPVKEVLTQLAEAKFQPVKVMKTQSKNSEIKLKGKESIKFDDAKSFPIKDRIFLRDFEKDILSLLEDKSAHKAYIVGGTLRSRLSQKRNQPGSPLYIDPKKDVDIITSRSPDEICHLLEKYGARPTLKNNLFHIRYIDQNQNEIHVDIRCSPYQTLKEDALNRDITQNALFADKSGDVIDPLNRGIKDLDNNVIEPILPAAESYKQDPSRILRNHKTMVDWKVPDTQHHRDLLVTMNECTKFIATMKESERIHSWLMKLFMNKKVSRDEAKNNARYFMDHNIQEKIFDPDFAKSLKTVLPWICYELQNRPCSLQEIYMIFWVGYVSQNSKFDKEAIYRKNWHLSDVLITCAKRGTFDDLFSEISGRYQTYYAQQCALHYQGFFAHQQLGGAGVESLGLAGVRYA